MFDVKQLQKMQKELQDRMAKVQEELKTKTVEASAGGGMVTAVARGDGSVAEIRIDPKVVDPADVEMLQDLVLAAVDGAIKAAREMAAAEMSKLTSGLGLPSM